MPEAAALRQPVRILVVDDEPLNLEIIAEHLDADLYRLDVFDSAIRAWQHLQAQESSVYDLILLDRMMPGMDGMELLHALKADIRFRQTPVVMQTAASSPQEVAEGVAGGAYYYLAKPYSGQELRAIVSAALSWQMRVLEPLPLAEEDGVFEFQTLQEARQLAVRLGQHCPDPAAAAMGLAELFVNAIEHGNLGITYAEKTALRLAGNWEAEVERRLALPENIGRKASVELHREDGLLTFTVRDCGPGFDWMGYLEISPERAFDPNGRGIAVARQIAFAHLEYLGCGNTAVASIATRKRRPVAGATQGSTGQEEGTSGLSLKVLVVDDTAVNRQILKVFLERLGYLFLGAADGEEALAAFVRERPDVVLMDVMMPQINGYEATRRIRELSGERWVPVIFISALERNDNLIDGLEAGGDDFMSKPINFIVLDAKLRSLCRMVELQRRVEAYREQQERERSLTREIVERQMARPGLGDPCIQHWVAPAQDFSGDIVAASRARDGRLFAMLADGAGHGLAPAISVMPVLSMFYSLIEWAAPSDLPGLVGELNRQLLATLPRGRFVASALVCVDEQTRAADIWIGGIPVLFWLGQDRRIKRRFSSRHLSLGIVDSDAEQLECERVEWVPGDCFVACSDGLIESAIQDGEALGVERFAALLEACPPEIDLLSYLRATLKLQFADYVPMDDISVMVVNCRAVT